MLELIISLVALPPPSPEMASSMASTPIATAARRRKRSELARSSDASLIASAASAASGASSAIADLDVYASSALARTHQGHTAERQAAHGRILQPVRA